MELRSLLENHSHLIHPFVWTSLFIFTSFFTFPLLGLEDVTIRSETTKDMNLGCNPPCNANGNLTLECVDDSCECVKLGYTAEFNDSLNGYDCIDNNECLTQPNHCDETSSVCENTPGSFRCKCKDGFTTAISSTECKDIDECSENLHNCDNTTSLCKNTAGSYECDCLLGFSSDGDNVCSNINECLMNPTPCNDDAQICTDTNGSFMCTCLDGTASCGSCKVGNVDCIIFIALCAVLVFIIIVNIHFAVCIYILSKTTPTPRERTTDVELVQPEEVHHNNIGTTAVVQETNNIDVLLIPIKNIHLERRVSGKGKIEYHKAKVTLPDRNEEQDAVVKTIEISGSPSGESTLITNEVKKLSFLPTHPYLVHLLGWCDTAPSYIIFEFIPGSSLLVGLKEGHVSKSNRTKTALEVARGMKFLSEKGFLHPGLRAKKILLSESGVCKLFDFVPEEIALELKKLAWNEQPPYQWLSPECLSLEELTRTGDVWSFGVLLWEIFSKGEQPFGGKDKLSVEECIRQEEEILPKPQACPTGVWELIIQCWEKGPEERTTFQHLSGELFLMTQESAYQM